MSPFGTKRTIAALQQFVRYWGNNGHAERAAVALQAIVCWPQALNLWQPDYTFRPHGFPLAAALRIEPQAGYLARTVPEYQVARMVDQHTPVDARIFSF